MAGRSATATSESLMGRALASVTALLIAAALLQLGNGVQFTLIPLRGELAGFGLMSIGLITAGYFAGFLLGSMMGPGLIGEVGHIRVLTGALAGIAALVLAYPLMVDGAVWTLARLGTGFALALAYMSIESWLNERAPNTHRGRVLALYALSGFFMLALGQGILVLVPAPGYEPFSIAAIIVALAALPVAFSRSPAPALIARSRPNLSKLFAISRVAVVGIIAVGLANGAFWAYAPVFAARAGLAPSEVAIFMAAVLLGAAAMLWPVGALSDRTDRRLVIGAINLGASLAASLIIVTAGHSLPALAAAGFVYGAFAFSIHSVAVAHANDNAGPADYLTLAGSLLFILGASSLVGPIVAFGVMAAVGPEGVFLFTAAVHLIAGAAAFALVRRRAPPAKKTSFQPVPRTTAAAYELAERDGTKRSEDAETG